MPEMRGKPTVVQCGHIGIAYFAWTFPDKDDRPIELYLCEFCYNSMVGVMAQDFAFKAISHAVGKQTRWTR